MGARFPWLESLLRDVRFGSRALLRSRGGIVTGAAGAWVLAGAIASLEYGVSVFDPLSWALVLTLLAITVLIATWRPAQEAARVDPVLLLRDE
jgi:putative ABC transport system permease protein